MIKSDLMNKWAVIKTGGKQYKVAEGDLLNIEKLQSDRKDSIVLEEVLLISDANSLILGKPCIKNAKVRAKIVKNFRDKKVRVVKYKSKSRYLRTGGHRQTKTSILIEKIES